MPEPDVAVSTTSVMAFNRAAHLNYFLVAANVLPSHYTSLDVSRLSAIYFAVVALDLLDALDCVPKEDFVEYVYLLQLTSSDESIAHGHFGFIGGTFAAHNVITVSEDTDALRRIHLWRQQQGHIAMTYTALCTLASLGDDFSRVDRKGIEEGLRHLLTADGSYRPYVFEGEGGDVRFVYCAMAIAHMLNLWHVVDKTLTTQYLLSCLSYEGGFGLQPGAEAQGGATFCALASLCLMGTDDQLSTLQRRTLISWCQRREQCGFEGRTNKTPDSCYAFWIGGTLTMLDAFAETDQSHVEGFLLSQCQAKSGGFSKLPDTYPDLLHSFYSLSWMALAGKLQDMDPRLAIRKARTVAFEQQS